MVFLSRSRLALWVSCWVPPRGLREDRTAEPDAPEEIRGTFQPMATNAGGIRITDQMPRMARVMDKCAIIRTMRHATGNHPAATYWMMVGSPMGRATKPGYGSPSAYPPDPGRQPIQVVSEPR